MKIFTNRVGGVAHVSPIVRALSVLDDEDVLGAGLLVLQPGLPGDVEDLAVPVPDHPGPRLPRHHAGQLRLEAPPGLEDVLLQRQDGGGEENLEQVILTRSISFVGRRSEEGKVS